MAQGRAAGPRLNKVEAGLDHPRNPVVAEPAGGMNQMVPFHRTLALGMGAAS